MKNIPLSLRILKKVLTFCWWLFIALAALLIVVCAKLSFFPLKDTDLAFTGFARHVKLGSLAAHTRDGQAATVVLEEPVKIKVRVPVESVQSGRTILVATTFLLAGACLAMALYFLGQFRDLVRTVEAGDPFVPENARRVRIIGIVILLGGIVLPLAEALAGALTDTMFVTEGFNFSTRLTLNWTALIAGLSIIALSEVFRHGTRLREEQALTV